MRWKWSEAKLSGSRRKSSRLAGGAKINIVIILCLLALIGWGVAVFSRPYLRKNKFEHIMAERIREFGSTGQEGMIRALIELARKQGLPELSRDDFEFEGGVGKDSVLRVSYKERVRLFDDKWYIIPMVAEKQLHIPLQY